MQIAIFRDLPKISTNEIYAGKHWSWRKKRKEEYLWLTKNIIQKLRPEEKKVDLKFVFYFQKNALDSDNCGFMGKMIIDCLIEYGVLKNDNINFVGCVSYESKKSAKGFDYCELSILPNSA